MSMPQFDVTPFLRQDEGQHFDRKSLWEGREGAKRARNRRAVRDQGEGIPRMFAEMVDAFLPQPDIEASPRGVSVTLRNTPTLTSADREFVARLGSTDVSDEEFARCSMLTDSIAWITPICAQLPGSIHSNPAYYCGACATATCWNCTCTVPTVTTPCRPFCGLKGIDLS